MALRLSLRSMTGAPIEVAGLLPAAVRGLSRAQVERWPVLHGNREVPLAELFGVSGDAADDIIEFHAAAGVHRIGAGMAEGTIRVEGHAGRHLGSEMSGGTIEVEGDAGDWLGAEMRGGRIHVRGDAGHHVGAAYHGSPTGMRGGEILVGGSAGDEVAHTMRRGLIAIGGSVGDFAGINMIAGSLFVFGDWGERPGAGMRRGSLVALGSGPRLLPTFRGGAPCRPLFVALYLRHLASAGMAAAVELLAGQTADGSRFALYHGDLVAAGRGEVMIRA